MSYTKALCTAEYPHLAHDWRSPTAWSRCPGITIPPATRARPPSARHHVVAELRSIKDQIARRITRWAASSVDLDGDRWVPRRVEDFPENSAEAWAALARMCKDTIADLHTVQTYATTQARAVDAFERQRERDAREVIDALRVRG